MPSFGARTIAETARSWRAARERDARKRAESWRRIREAFAAARTSRGETA